MPRPIGLCEICGKTKHLIAHHISYSPEILLWVCNGCHFCLHHETIETLENIIKLKKEYGHLWFNGAEKYAKSLRNKERRNQYGRSEKGKEAWRRWYYKNQILNSGKD